MALGGDTDAGNKVVEDSENDRFRLGRDVQGAVEGANGEEQGG
jgi:hypothetical protein